MNKTYKIVNPVKYINGNICGKRCIDGKLQNQTKISRNNLVVKRSGTAIRQNTNKSIYNRTEQSTKPCRYNYSEPDSVSKKLEELEIRLKDSIKLVSDDSTDISLIVTNIKKEIFIIKSTLHSLENKVNSNCKLLDDISNRTSTSDIIQGVLGICIDDITEVELNSCYKLINDCINITVVSKDIDIFLKKNDGVIKLIDFPYELVKNTVSGTIHICNKEARHIYVGVVYDELCKNLTNSIRYNVSNRPIIPIGLNFTGTIIVNISVKIKL